MLPGGWCKLLPSSPPRVDELVGKWFKADTRSESSGSVAAWRCSVCSPPAVRSFSLSLVWIYLSAVGPAPTFPPRPLLLWRWWRAGGVEGDDSLDSIGGARSPRQPSESRVAISLLCDGAFMNGMKLWETVEFLGLTLYCWATGSVKTVNLVIFHF